MLNEIQPGILDIRYFHHRKIRDDDFLLCIRDNLLLLKNSGDNLEIPRKKDFTGIIESPVYLFSIRSISFFGSDTPGMIQPELEFHDLFVLRRMQNKESAWIGSLGYQLMTWYINNRFCGKCGCRTIFRKEERAIICPECSLTVFPKISPAVIVAVTCGNKILLAKGKNYKGDFYALIAGYADPGESIEETAAREVKEEVGLDIRNLKYYKSQPWPFSSSLMLGFYAEADDTQQIIIDENEIKEAAWFTRDNLPDYASNISISGELIDAFKNGIF